MGKTTGISWTDYTYNPWQGCRRVSAGCANCYMYRDKRRFKQDPERIIRSKPDTFRNPLRWKEPGRVFVCSWSDWCIPEADEWRADAWEIMRQAPHHTYLILTKRPERLASCLPPDWGQGWPNVWLGVSVESQKHAGRLDDLARVPAAVRFCSAEPLLGPLNLRRWMCGGFLDWLIVGGESGPNFRPMDMEWVRALRNQATEEGVAFFFKQDAGIRPGSAPSVLELDGTRTRWQQFPQPRGSA